MANTSPARKIILEVTLYFQLQLVTGKRMFKKVRLFEIKDNNTKKRLVTNYTQKILKLCWI